MTIALQVLFGFIMGVAAIAVSDYLGPFPTGQLNWGMGAEILFLVAVTQWAAFLAVRRRIVLQVFFGLIVCAIVVAGFIFLPVPIFWETQYPDGSSPVTWRSDLVFLSILALTQWSSLLIFRRIRGNRGR